MSLSRLEEGSGNGFLNRWSKGQEQERGASRLGLINLWFLKPPVVNDIWYSLADWVIKPTTMSVYWDQVAFKILPFAFAVALGFIFYYLKSDKPEGWLLAALAAWVIAGLFFAALVHEKIFAETETSGLLHPASEPTPHNPCGTIPKGACVLLFGDSASYTTAFPHTILRVAGQDLLSIDRKNGGIAVSAKIYSADRKIITEISDNNFHINPSNYFRRERPDRHTLVVFDQQGQRVLYVRHINSSAIKVLGTFHSPRGIIRIEENRVVLPGGTVVSRFCAGNVRIAINMD